MGYGSPQQPGPTSGGDGELCAAGHCGLWSACGGMGELPGRWSLRMERVRGMAAPSSAGPLAGATGNRAQTQVAEDRLRGTAASNGAGPWVDGTVSFA